MTHSAISTTRLSPDSMAETLMLPSWGRWARPRYIHELGAKASGWVHDIESGWREDPREYVPPIDDDYAEELDASICEFLSAPQKDILREIYVYGSTFKRAAGRLGSTLHNVRQDRDTAVGILYGALQYRKKNT